MSDPWVSGFDAVGDADAFLVGQHGQDRQIVEVVRGGTGEPVLTRVNADELGTARCAYALASSQGEEAAA